MTMKLFEYAAIYQPKPTRDAMGNDTTQPAELIVPVTQVLASSEKAVAMLVARDLPEEYADKLDNVEIVIRPF